MEELIEEIRRAAEHALDVEQRNRAAGSAALSTAWDSGRYAGLTEALEIVQRYAAQPGI